MNKYIIDTSVLIDWQDYLPKEYFPDFWKWVQDKIDNNSFYTIHPVKDELGFHDDFIKRFVGQQKDGFFLGLKEIEDTIEEFRSNLIKEIKNKNNTIKEVDIEKIKKKVNRFISKDSKYNADVLLVLKTSKLNEISSNNNEGPLDKYILLNNEDYKKKEDYDINKKIKIPSVCKILNIPCMNHKELLEAEKKIF